MNSNELNYEPFVIISKSDDTQASKSKALDLKDDEFNYPFEMDELTDAYTINPYHAECIEKKAINILGKGFDKRIMDILEEVTPTDSAITLLLKTIKDYEMYGNAYWELPKVGSKRQIFHLPAQTMRKIKTGYRQTVNGESVDFNEDEVFHFKQATPLSTIYGAPSYLPILPDIRIIKRIKTYNERFFDNNAIPDYVYEIMGGAISPNAQYNVQSFFRQKFQGEERAHKLLVIPYKEGMSGKWTALQQREDASFLKLEQQCITNIIACHAVPPRLLSMVNTTAMGGSGETEGQMEIFFQTTIHPKQLVLSGQFGGLAKKYPGIFGNNPDFTINPLVYNIKENTSVDSLLRRS
jgi:capsid portal protein